MQVMVVEDEPPARERLRTLLRAWDPGLEVAAAVGSVQEARAWLVAHGAPDLVLLDVQLADGLGTELLREPGLTCPVVMVTAYDEYVLEALAHNCIDYVLKPVQPERLHQALDKYLRLRAHFAGNGPGLAHDLARPARARTRVVVRKGVDFMALPLADVAYFFTEHKLVFARDHRGVQYLVDRPLAELEAELDPARFFRLNRRLIAQVDAIRRFRPADKGRVMVVLEPPPAEPVQVSQERAAAFREWMGR
jgi:DNA-binding LytR/AlgR family response regulator